MRRIGGIVFALALVAPWAVEAQTRPASTMQTNSAELYFDRARRSNRDEEKKELLQKALGFALDGIKARADNPKAYLLAGQIYVQLAEAAAADSMFDKAEQLWPAYGKEIEPERLQVWIRSYNAGIVALRANNTDEAIKQFESAVQVFDKRAGAHLNLAQIYARKNQNDKAIGAYKAALSILSKPENRTGLKPEEEAQAKEFEEAATFNMAQLLATTGKNEEALAAYQDFLTRNPEHKVAKSNVAVVLSRMGKAAEAAKIYSELLAQDLTADEFFSVGVGLFRATQHEPAAQAFRKATAKNPNMRDAYYNLAQATYSLASELEPEKAKATGAPAKELETRLAALYTEIGQVTEKLRTIDPANRNVIALQSRAYRALGDLTAADGKASAEWKNKTLEVLKANEALTFTVEDIVITSANGEVQVTGNVVNQKGTKGQAAKLRFHILGNGGADLGTQDVSVTLPDVQGAATFKITFKATDVAGWKYEVVQ